MGGKYCRKKKFNYSPGGINHLLKFLKEDTNIIFDCTSADVSKKIYYKIKDKLNKNFYLVTLINFSINIDHQNVF